jgi:hypothetical protein
VQTTTKLVQIKALQVQTMTPLVQMKALQVHAYPISHVHILLCNSVGLLAETVWEQTVGLLAETVWEQTVGCWRRPCGIKEWVAAGDRMGTNSFDMIQKH